jgi:hypothetical protein
MSDSIIIATGAGAPGPLTQVQHLYVAQEVHAEGLHVPHASPTPPGTKPRIAGTTRRHSRSARN